MWRSLAVSTPIPQTDVSHACPAPTLLIATSATATIAWPAKLATTRSPRIPRLSMLVHGCSAGAKAVFGSVVSPSRHSDAAVRAQPLKVLREPLVDIANALRSHL